MLSYITPPIALACTVTCKIADADFIQTGIESVKIGIVLFILLFIMIFNESLLSFSGLETIRTFFLVAIDVILFTWAVHSDWEKRTHRYASRAVVLVASVGLMFSHSIISLGIVIL